MENPSINHYAEKSDVYYEDPRPEMVRLIPASTKRLLDVGCGNGLFSWNLKKKIGIEEVVGIEYFEDAAAKAVERLDKVLAGDVELMNLDFEENYFDCIICADILEHLKNPWSVLNNLVGFLSPNGRMIISLPNLRHIVPVLKIIFDRFDYEESGVLDKTHLRFFTLSSMKKMFNEAGLTIERIESNRSVSLKFRIANILSLGAFKPFTVYQYIFVLRKK